MQRYYTGIISTLYDSRTGSEAGARAWLQFVGDEVKTARHPRKSDIFVRLKNEDDRADSDASGGLSVRGHPGHEGEDGPSSDPESWWRGGPGPVAVRGPTEDEMRVTSAGAHLVEMRSLVEAL